MKRSILCVLVFGLCLVSVGRAQTVTGSGTIGTLPIFTGSSTIGNSAILQLGGSTAIGATAERIGTKFEVITDSTTPPFPGQGPDAIYGEATGNADFTSAIFGLASGTSALSNGVAGISYNGTGVVGQGGQNGVVGATSGPSGLGVSGNNSSTAGGGGGGIIGVTEATSGYSFGARGDARGNSGFVVGVQGITNSPQGDGGRFVGVKGASGTIIRGDFGPPGAGTETTVFRVDGHGTIFADGGFRPFGADFAESLAVKGSREHYAPGDLLVIDVSGERRLSLAETPYSTLVAGIYSTKPGVVASQHPMDDPAFGTEVPLAVVGIVPCKGTAENGPIAVGDLLVASSTPGHAMKGTERAKMLGAIVGKALQPLGEGKGVIQVLVTLQ